MDANTKAWTFGAISWSLILVYYCYYTRCKKHAPRQYPEEQVSEAELAAYRVQPPFAVII